MSISKYLSAIVLMWLTSSCSQSKQKDPSQPDKQPAEEEFKFIRGVALDQAGNEFKTIQIENDLWMAENLNVSTFNNGEKILRADNMEEWQRLLDKEKPAWCYYNFDSTNYAKYGKIYNGHVVTNKGGVAPKGWKIPNDDDWEFHLIGHFKQTKKLTWDNGTIGWNVAPQLKHATEWEKNTDVTICSGFDALPCGSLGYDGPFGVSELVFFWADTPNVIYKLFRNSPNFERWPWASASEGHFIRCIKETTTTGD